MRINKSGKSQEVLDAEKAYRNAYRQAHAEADNLKRAKQALAEATAVEREQREEEVQMAKKIAR